MFVGLRTDRQTDGHCRNRDLLREEMEAGSADSKRLDLIRGMAKDRQWIKRVSMPTTGGGPKRRRAEALRRLNNVSAPA
jgi:hypothetical protein